ncbi:amidohydrolase family protein [Pseudonocardia sp. KRD291]|uniref:amidohydrolase family protein n=1 Tax=Pseudonocardia sp. KRD291 TaxID=2792007 RepID=UPI0027E35E25|nr:amidohydrolase family protein [Pseudonocardia sp. KRD291]
MDLPAPPVSDDDVPRWTAELGLPGLVDTHVHFLPERMLAKVWDYFDHACEHYGRAWPVHYRLPENERLRHLERMGVTRFAPLTYPHKPGMARWLTGWAAEFSRRNPSAVRTATLFPEPDVTEYLGEAVEGGARMVKVHVQVGGFDPRDELLAPAWGLLADAGVPAIVHCGNGPIPGRHTGLDIFGDVLDAHPRLKVVLAHAGLPDYTAALELMRRHENLMIDTTMVGTPFSEDMAPLPADWPASLVEFADRVVLGTDFPNIPYAYVEQLVAIHGWAAADDRLGLPFLRSVLHDTPAAVLGVRDTRGAPETEPG